MQNSNSSAGTAADGSTTAQVTTSSHNSSKPLVGGSFSPTDFGHEKYLGRKVKEKKEFKVDGTFQSMYAAQGWLKEKGYDYGSSCAMMPTAVMKGDYYSYDLPHKWKNFTATQKNNVDGVVTGDMRDGIVYVYLFN